MKNVETINFGKCALLIFVIVSCGLSSSCSVKEIRPYSNEKSVEKVGAYEMYLKLTFDCIEATKANYNQATLWLKKALELGDNRALYPLAHRLILEGSLDSIKEGLTMLKRSAAIGNVESSRELGDIFLKGKIVNENTENARIWYEKAARQGHIHAMIAYSKLVEFKHQFAWILLASSRVDSASVTGMNLAKSRKKSLSSISKAHIQESLNIYFDLVNNIPFLNK